MQINNIKASVEQGGSIWEKILNILEGLGLTYFKSPTCCISATLKRNKKVVNNLHGESNDMTDGERDIIMSTWRKDFYAKIMEVGTHPKCVYSA